MTNDAGFGVLGGEFLQQLVERVLLGLGAGVFCNASCIQTTLIHNTEGTVVVVAGMNALNALWQQGDDTAIIADIVVVRALAILGFAAGNEVFHTERSVAGVGDTVDDDELDCRMFEFFHS